MKESEIIVAVQPSAKGGYEARALRRSIFTQADSLNELREMVRDAVSCHFDADSIPEAARLHFVDEQAITD